MLQITKLDKSKVEITSSITADEFSSFRKKALENINNEINIDGFRKGKIPENVLISKVGDMMVLEEMAELAISKHYPDIVEELSAKEKIEAIGKPEVSITKIASGSPLEFKIVTSVLPEIKTGDYKKITKKVIGEMIDKEKDFLEVTDKDVDDAILRIRRSRADHSSHDHGKMTAEEHDKMTDSTLPELTQEFIKSLGDFNDLEDLKTKIKISLSEDKKLQMQEKRRIAFSDAILESSSFEIPELLIESETRRIEAQFSDDVSRMGVSLDAYLQHAKKTIEDLRNEWRPHAEKKAKLQLILNNIGELENIRVDKKEIEEEVGHILSHYKNANQEQAYIYAETVLTNEKIYQFLESLK